MLRLIIAAAALACQFAFAQQDFAILAASAPAKTCTRDCRVTVVFKGSAPASATDPLNWTLAAVDQRAKQLRRVPVTGPVTVAKVTSAESMALLPIDMAGLGGIDPQTAEWRVGYGANQLAVLVVKPKQEFTTCLPACKLEVTMWEDLPPSAGVGSNWTIVRTGTRIEVPVRAVTFEPLMGGGRRVIFTLDLSTFGEDLQKVPGPDLHWLVRFNSTETTAFFTSTPFKLFKRSGPCSVTVQAAKARADADLYLMGSGLFGEGSSPIYQIDAKLQILPCSVFSNAFGRIRFGVFGDVLVNPQTKPPQNETEIDPDSIKAGFVIDGLKAASVLGETFNGVLWQIRPLAGEYSAEFPAGNRTTEARIGLSLTPRQIGGGWLTFYPVGGYEIGTNTDKPAKLFKREVDIQAYDDIRRLRLAGDAVYTIFGAAENPKLSLSSSFQTRILFADEPFTTLEYLYDANGQPQYGEDGYHKREKVVRMRRNPRHFVQTKLTWNVGQFLGLTFEHRHGSMPPLFQMNRHTLVVGFTFKAKLWEGRAAQ